MRWTALPLLSTLSLLLSWGLAPPVSAGDDVPGAVTIDRIQSYDAAAQSTKLSEGFEGMGFRATYEVVCGSKKDEHEFRVVDKDLLFRVDQGRVLKIRGAGDLNDKLRGDWFCGDKVPSNKVELRFDGDRLTAIINGEQFGPVWVRKGNPVATKSTFAISINGDGTRIENLRVAPWHTTKYQPLTIERVTPQDAKATKLRLDRDWHEARWIMEFDYTTTDRKPRLLVEARELQYAFEIAGSRLTVTGREREARIELGGSGWHQGTGETNHVVARFDGEALSFDIGGQSIGPLPARKELSNEKNLTWALVLTDAVLESFVVRRFELDRDGDGVGDPRDGCPDVPEDTDGFEDEDGCPDPDNDKDGILDGVDRCPDEAENKNNWEDSDGCPDEISDSDGDGINDVDDRCPRDREDKDGFEDADGCPDPDNDKDGILDAADRCPDVPETRNGFKDEDGCPDDDPDSDGDGIVDSRDGCASLPEDKDGFEDDDGCPDLDNDGDGIVDAADQCPNVPESVNGFEDADGCPDHPVATTDALAQVEEVVVENKVVRRIKIRDRVFFDTGLASIRPESFAVLDAVVDVLEDHPEMKRIRIEGHTDGEGGEAANLDLSQRRTASVKVYLVGRGIDPDRLIPQGFGESRPIDSNETVTGRAVNRRVEFVVLD